jgi:hypothetical protein
MNIEQLNKANKEIAELKAELAEHDDQITNIEIVNQEILAVADAKFNRLVDENNGLKAKFEIMRGISLSSDYDDIYHLIEELTIAMNNTPAQSLASVKADAVDCLISFIGDCGAPNKKHYESVATFDAIQSASKRYANKLRKQK